MSAKQVKVKTKVKKPHKYFNKENLMMCLKSLYSNRVCFDAGFKSSWYVALIIFVVCILAAMTPLSVHASQVSGSSFFTSYTANDSFKYGLVSFEDNSSYDLTFTKNSEDKMSAKLTDRESGQTASTPSSTGLIYSYDQTVDNGGSVTSKTTLEVYYIPGTNTEFVNKLNGDSEGQTGIINMDSKGMARTSSMIAFGETMFYGVLYTTTSSGTTAPSISGDYDHFDGFLNKLNKSSFTFLNDYLVKENSKATEGNNLELYFYNFADFTDTVYINNRNLSIWVQSGISLGVNGGMIILVMLIYFLMSLGKRSVIAHLPKRKRFLPLAKATCWAAITPALLTLIIGFCLPAGYEIMIFVICFGFRSMFFAMRQLRPQVQ